MARNYVRDSAPLSRFGVLVAQLESIVASAAHKPPDPLLCFDLLSDLISAIHEEPKDSLLLWQRKCEDALYSLLVLGARRPVRHLASVAMAKVILKGDPISIYSRASTLQGFLSDAKKGAGQKVAGAAQCLGELYRYFGRRIVSGLLETTNIVAKLLKFSEEFVRQESLQMLYNALEGSEGHAAPAAYIEAFRVITRIGVGDKSLSVRIASARCLKAFANIGGPGLGSGELENCLSSCVKALGDPVKTVRDAFAEALGALLALGMNPDAQVQPRGKSQVTPKKLEGGLMKHLVIPFTKVSGPHLKDIRVGLSLSWVCFLQAICLKYLHPDSELEQYALQVLDMLRADTSSDAQALACVLYILKVGITDQMSEPTQRSFSVFLGQQLLSSDSTPSMRIAALRTLSYVLKTLGEVPLEFREVLDDTVFTAVSHHSPLVRVEAALALRALAEVDPSCVGGLISYSVTMLSAARESVSFEKDANLEVELASLHGQAAVLAALVSVSRKLPLGYPARLSKSVLGVCKSLLMESSRNPVAASVQNEAGWTLLSSLLASMSKEELHDQVFDILALWASLFSGDPKQHVKKADDLAREICVWSAAIDALTSFVKCFIVSDSVDRGILLQPVLFYLNWALSCLSHLVDKEQVGIKPTIDLFAIRVLSTYQALSDPSLYKSDHARIIHFCTTPFREPSRCEESSSLRTLLDRRDAWLGPWIPGRDWFEDELRSFQGGKDGVLTCVWDLDPPSFPQPETISKMLVNQMLLSFGTMFASQDSSGMLSFLSTIDQCLKAGKRQPWHASSVTNICVGLLAGLKNLLAQRPEPLGTDVLIAAQTVFQNILSEGDIWASQRRASSEGLGLLARLGNDIFAARLTKQFLADVAVTVDSSYAGSIALALGCIHRSAGGMALSSLVPTTVNVVSSLAKSSISSLQIWSLHGLLLTIEAAGLSYLSHVQATLGLAMDILLSEEGGLVDLQQTVGRLINAIVAVLGPELAPGSIFFSRCTSAIAEISSCQETASLLESVRFRQQLVLFAPQAVSVHSHVLTLLPTLSSRQPALRHLALSTLRHLIEKDPVSVIDEQIEETLFHMLDEETDIEIGNLARATIMRLLYASCPSRPSRWLSICRSMILSTSSRHAVSMSNNLVTDSSSGPEGDKRLNLGDDDDSMVSTSNISQIRNHTRDTHLRYRTRVFAAECLNHIPQAVGESPDHFDLSLARVPSNGPVSGDMLVLQLQELISLAYQISTIQFEKMRPIGVSLLCSIMDKFGAIIDPELPDHLLLEQYQAQLVSAVRSALDSFSDPILLEAGLQLATKMLTSGIISRDQVAVKRIFSLISRPLDDFSDLYYPSYAEWVSCKIKVRLLLVHASLRCYIFAFLRRQGDEIPEEYLALLPLLSKSSRVLGAYWLSLLKDYSFIRFHLQLESWKPFLDGIQSAVVSAELQPCLEEAWPVILQALVLDAVPANSIANGSLPTQSSKDIPFSGYSMFELRLDEFQFLWGFLLLVLFQEQDVNSGERIIPVSSITSKFSVDIPRDDSKPVALNLYDMLFPVFKYLSMEKFFSAGFLPLDTCRELLQVFTYSIFGEDPWDGLASSILSQVIRNCPKDFLEVEDFAHLASELCLTSLFKSLSSCSLNSRDPSSWDKIVQTTLLTVSTLLERFEPQMNLKLLLPSLLIGYKCIGEASTDICLSKIIDFLQSIMSSIKRLAKSELGTDGSSHLVSITRACLNATTSLTTDCIGAIHQLESKRSNSLKLLLLKLAFSIEQIFSYATLAFEFEKPGERKESNPVLFRLLHHSTECMQAVLSDSDIQVQAVGLQVVKVMLQKGVGSGSYSFLIFYVGELVGDMFRIILHILKNPINREAVAIAGECLKIFMILQTFSKGIDVQKGFIHLLLEAILMIFSTSEGSVSQEAKELRETAVKLVSQLAQIPSSAGLIKDILLAMPVTQRQQLQDLIRASVVQDTHPKPVSSGPSLVIKLPSHTSQTGGSSSLPLTPPHEPNKHSAKEEEVEDDDDDDDDWDTFQSFPASANENAPTPENAALVSDHGSGDNDSSSFTEKKNHSGENQELNQELDEGPSSLGTSEHNQKDERHDPVDGHSSAPKLDDISRESDKNMSSDPDNRLLPNMESNQVEVQQSEPSADHFDKVEIVVDEKNQLSADDVHHESGKPVLSNNQSEQLKEQPSDHSKKVEETPDEKYQLLLDAQQAETTNNSAPSRENQTGNPQLSAHATEQGELSLKNSQEESKEKMELSEKDSEAASTTKDSDLEQQGGPNNNEKMELSAQDSEVTSTTKNSVLERQGGPNNDEKMELSAQDSQVTSTTKTSDLDLQGGPNNNKKMDLSAQDSEVTSTTKDSDLEQQGEPNSKPTDVSLSKPDDVVNTVKLPVD